MIIKDKFELLKNVPNTINLSESDIDNISIENGSVKIFATLELAKKRISHFSKNKVFEILSDIKKREHIHLVNLKNYILPVTYNNPTKGIVLNLSYFNTDDISRVDSRNIYSCMVYGITLQSLIENDSLIKNSYFSVIVNFLNSILVRVFAKEYGLLGLYSVEIPKMKFLLSCYILESFFGIVGDKAYKISSSISIYDYKPIYEDLKNINFSKIEDFIKSLNMFKVMPGIEKYKFTSKLLRFLGVNFLAGFEDCSRFMSFLSASNVSGNSVFSTFIFRYNEYEFSKVLTILKSIF